MSKQFVLLKTAGKLENYLSRERYALEKMKDNDRVSESLFETKVGHYNELVDLLNVLFCVFSDVGSTGKLFESYGSVTDLGSIVDAFLCEELEKNVEKEFVVIPEPEVVPIEDVQSHDDEWLLKKSEDVGLKAQRSKEVVDEMVTEYENSDAQSIEDYVPEDDTAVSVLPDALSDRRQEPVRVTGGLDYLNHTHDNVRVNDDPTQIVDVETAVEMKDNRYRQATDIDVGCYVHRSPSGVYEDIIANELEKLRHFDPTTDEYFEEHVSSDVVEEDVVNVIAGTTIDDIIEEEDSEDSSYYDNEDETFISEDDMTQFIGDDDDEDSDI